MIFFSLWISSALAAPAPSTTPKIDLKALAPRAQTASSPASLSNEALRYHPVVGYCKQQPFYDQAALEGCLRTEHEGKILPPVIPDPKNPNSYYHNTNLAH